MNPDRMTKVDATAWRIEPTGPILVPAIIYADESLIRDMDDKVGEQAANVASLPGVVQACYVMPDAHWGYGFPIGGVAAFDPNQGGVVSAGGVGFDISCGVRTMRTGLSAADVLPVQKALADSLCRDIPTGVGSRSEITLDLTETDEMLVGGAHWAVACGWGEPEDLERIEDGGRIADAEPDSVSNRAKQRQVREMGTLGSGNHYLEAQVVAEIFDPSAAAAFGLKKGDVVVAIHCGSRGLGHQVAADFAKDMVVAAQVAGIALRDRELACAPIKSEIGQRYLGAMRAAMNCALANREILGHYVRDTFRRFSPAASFRCCSMFRTTPARSKRTLSMGSAASLSFIARAPRAPSGPVTTACRPPCGRSVSPSSSAAAWEQPPTFSSERNLPKQSLSLRPVTAPAAHCPATPLSGNGAGARSSTNSPRRA